MVINTINKIEKACIVAVRVRGFEDKDGWTLEERLEELYNLVNSSGAEVVEVVVQTLNKNSTTYMGKGKLRELAQLIKINSIDVVIFDDDTPYDLIKNLQPEIIVKGGDYTLEQVIGGDFVHSYDGEVKALEFLDNCSTSAIMEKLKEVGD